MIKGLGKGSMQSWDYRNILFDPCLELLSWCGLWAEPLKWGLEWGYPFAG